MALEFYEAKPGMWLVQGVSIEEHERAVASNWDGPGEWDFGEQDYDYTSLDRAIDLDEQGEWRTRAGRYVKHEDITGTHLDNLISLLIRNNFNVEETFPNLWKEYQRRITP